MNNTYVLDAFALIGFFRAEPFAEQVRDMLNRHMRNEITLVASVINVGEMYYKTAREFGHERADQVLAQFEEYAVDVVPVDWNLAFTAAALKGTYRISYADCIAAALTQNFSATLVTGDRGFEQIPGLDVEWLPAPQ